MTRMAKKLGLCAIVFILTTLMAGCSRQGEEIAPVPRQHSPSQTDLTEITGRDAETTSSEARTADRILTPAQMGFPPEQSPPWVMKVSPQPLSPVRSANTGDYRGKWPDYRCPREIFITAPELPQGIEGPTSDAMVGSSQGNS